MKYRWGSRPKLGFRPQLEQSEPRLLLSSGGQAHAQAGAHAQVILPDYPIDGLRRAYYYVFIHSVPLPTATIYAIVVTNDTPYFVNVSISANANTPGGSTEGNGLFLNGLDPRGQLLLMTDSANATFALEMSAKDGNFRGTVTYHASEGKATPHSKFIEPDNNPRLSKEAAEAKWKATTSLTQTNHFKIVIGLASTT